RQHIKRLHNTILYAKQKRESSRIPFFKYWYISYPFDKAAAPETISVNSVVMASCRAWLYDNFNAFTSSPAFSVALSIAVIRAPCSDALESKSALYNCVLIALGISSSMILSLEGSII